MLLVRNNIGHQALVARNILSAGTMVCRTGGGLAPPLSPRFDAEAAQLHLVVNAPEELDVAVRQVANQIPVLYRRAPGIKGLGMNGGQTWTVEVASTIQRHQCTVRRGHRWELAASGRPAHRSVCWRAGDRWEWL